MLEVCGPSSQSDVQGAGVGNDGRGLRVPSFHDETNSQSGSAVGRRDRDDVRAAGKANRRVSVTETGRCDILR